LRLSADFGGVTPKLFALKSAPTPNSGNATGSNHTYSWSDPMGCPAKFCSSNIQMDYAWRVRDAGCCKTLRHRARSFDGGYGWPMEINL